MRRRRHRVQRICLYKGWRSSLAMKLNVLQLIGNFEEGGSERQAVQLVRLLCESGRYHVRAACLDSRGPLRAEVERAVAGCYDQNRFLARGSGAIAAVDIAAAAVDIAAADIAAFPLTRFYDVNAARQMRAFIRFLKRERIDIIQSHDFYTNIFGMIGGRL